MNVVDFEHVSAGRVLPGSQWRYVNQWAIPFGFQWYFCGPIWFTIGLHSDFPLFFLHKYLISTQKFVSGNPMIKYEVFGSREVWVSYPYCCYTLSVSLLYCCLTYCRFIGPPPLGEKGSYEHSVSHIFSRMALRIFMKLTERLVEFEPGTCHFFSSTLTLLVPTLDEEKKFS